MNKIKLSLLCISLVLVSGCANHTGTGKWDIRTHKDNSVDILMNGAPRFESVGASFMYEGKKVTSADYPECRIKSGPVKDGFGEGVVVRLVYKGPGLPVMTRRFYLYDSLDYILTDISIEGKSNISTNYIAPVELPSWEVSTEGDGHALFIPFDNDDWIRYASVPLRETPVDSYEVSAVFANGSRNGIVAGSVDHDTWKTGIRIEQPFEGSVSIICFNGVADKLTRDSRPHGSVSGKRVTSSRIMLGMFDDWRDGMEVYADANAVTAPPRVWEHAVPFGWNSWGVLQFGLTADKSMEVSDYIREELQSRSFVNPDGTVVVWLDSGWSWFPEEKLAEFVERCHENGQQPGIYWTPFTDWGRQPERVMDDAGDYKFAHAYLYSDGQPQDLDGAYALDPTHPAIEMRMRAVSDLFTRLGFTYVKMDFMTHGAMEADRWYRDEIQTGMQAYNYGMALMEKYFGHMYINLSISPVFPARYANSRRIACDAWNKIKDTEYTLNALSYGWWQDRIYNFNDADHIVLRDATEGENRARVTSAVITGIYICGDDYSVEGAAEGKERSEIYLCNPRVNAVATGQAFRPVEGNGKGAEKVFVCHREGKSYLAMFNYGQDPASFNINTERTGLFPASRYGFTELWTGKTFEVSSETNIEIAGKDAMLFEITAIK